MFHWALVAAAVLMLLVAIRTLFVSSKKDSKGKLGWPFALVAAGLWIYVLRDYVGEFGPALRIGLGILLVMPAVQAIADPGKLRLVRAVGGLILAVLIAGPAVQELWNQHGLDFRPREEKTLEKERSNLLASREKYETYAAELRSEIRAYGNSWDAVSENPEALAKVEALEVVRERIAKIDAALAELSEPTHVPTVVEEEPDELEGIRESVRKEVGGSTESIVEQHAKKKALEDVFSREFE